ncbi:hypothetical protein Rhopal_007720-T1 [Rhodotorula paludigena]|uniref:Uncharacterized protein n=1 Tax=Rhodotorula paludigena TaxID=86838 RepID=A0AAV5GYL9_9BASI|nr:hypothetical protein Rhopal_007720-T1 [Rhodotorula paludigena]
MHQANSQHMSGLISAFLSRALSTSTRTAPSSQPSRLLTYSSTARPTGDALATPPEQAQEHLTARVDERALQERRASERQLEEDIRMAWEWSAW